MEQVKINSEKWLSTKNLDGEVWKKVEDYPMYAISNYGRLKRIERYAKKSNGKGKMVTHHYPEKIVKQSFNTLGYLMYRPSRDGHLGCVSIHRLVAKAFIPNPDNLPQVNHKDENPSNNRVSNLEWCTQRYNINYGTCQERRAATLRKNIRHKCFIVKQYTLDGKLVKEYIGKSEIVEAGFCYDSIVHCCKHQTQSAYGYVWRRNNDPFTSINYHYNTDSCKKIVLCYDMDMNFVAEYFGTKEAARAVGKPDKMSACISRCCNGGRPSAFGYIWKYK